MKSKINFVIDAVMLIVGSAMAGIGLLMKYALLPGRERNVLYGRPVDLYFLNLDRHEWGAVHLILGYVMIGLLVLHIVLHWKTIICLYRKLIANRKLRNIIAVLFVVISLLFLIFAFFIDIEVRDTGPGMGQHGGRRFETQSHIPRESGHAQEAPQAGHRTVSPESPAEPSGREGEVHEHRTDPDHEHENVHEHADSDIRVRGSMTLAEVSQTYDIPVDSLLSGLGLTQQLSGHTQLGHLRRRHGFHMTDVENIILQYRKNQGTPKTR